ncbi:MAG: hypothetical protein M3Y91_01260 [Actinomycetota bacterium]|nr:hypothetical protein [Actinomycetota bacterium]
MLTKANAPARPSGGRGSPRWDSLRFGRRPFGGQPAIAAIAVGLIVAVVVTGCGGPGPNGEAGKAGRQILADAQKATMSAPTVHVSGSGSTSTTPLKLNLVAGQGKGGGTITSGTSVLNLVLDKQNIFIKADAATIQSLSGNAATASSDANKWLQTSSTSSGFTGLSQLLDITRLPQSFTFGGVPTKQSATTFAGVAVVPVFDPKSGGTLYVATAGKPYIIGIKGAKSNGGATLTFDHYGTATVPGAPPNPVLLPNASG